MARHSLLIRNAELWNSSGNDDRADILVEGETISRIGRNLPAELADREVDANGGLLLPGLHDHHIHLAGLAVRAQSVWCGPPRVTDGAALGAALQSASGAGWIRGIGYHESVLGGLPDAAALDEIMPDRPLRMQHRSGRMWLLNSAALDLLLAQADPPQGMEREAGSFTGLLFDEDAWLRSALGSAPPGFGSISRQLARLGVTGLTDMTPQNGSEMAKHFARQRQTGVLMQSVTLAGTLELAEAGQDAWTLGPVKLHLHEADLPPFEEAVALARESHEQARALAIHCVSEVEIVFALALLAEAGTTSGDRIEHASVAAPGHISRMAQMGLAACVQPHFVAERGDQYLADIEPGLHRDLYRLRTLHEAQIALAGGSDAPFASHDPWAAMRAAVNRETASGHIIGLDEALTPEQALSLWLADPQDLSAQREISIGAPADLCLLRCTWAKARDKLSSDDVALTLASGQIVHQLVD